MTCPYMGLGRGRERGLGGGDKIFGNRRLIAQGEGITLGASGGGLLTPPRPMYGHVLALTYALLLPLQWTTKAPSIGLHFREMHEKLSSRQ